MTALPWYIPACDNTAPASSCTHPCRRRAPRSRARKLDTQLWMLVAGDQPLCSAAGWGEFERQIVKPVFHLIDYRLWV
jgi:hypothetical protein